MLTTIMIHPTNRHGAFLSNKSRKMSRIILALLLGFALNIPTVGMFLFAGVPSDLQSDGHEYQHL